MEKSMQQLKNKALKYEEVGTSFNIIYFFTSAI